MDVATANMNFQISDVFSTAEPLQSNQSINGEKGDYPHTVIVIEEMQEQDEGTVDVECDDLFDESIEVQKTAANTDNQTDTSKRNNLISKNENGYFVILNPNDYDQYNPNPLNLDECVLVDVANAFDTVNGDKPINKSKCKRNKKVQCKRKKKHNLTGKLKSKNESIIISDDDDDDNDLQPTKKHLVTKKKWFKEIPEPTEESILKEFYFEDEDICIVDELKIEGPQKTLVRRTKKGYQCPLYCTFVADQQPAMITHLINHKKSVTTKTEDSESAFECPMCPFMTFSHSTFVKHICCHKKSTYRVECSKCPYSTNSVDVLKKHIASKHAKFLHCHTCQFKTKNKLSLRKHESICIETSISFGNFKCRFEPCPFTTSVKQHMETHEWIQHQVDSSKLSMYKCPLDMCFFETFRKGLFDEHILMHTGEEFKCQLCNRRTGDFKGFKQHILHHISTP